MKASTFFLILLTVLGGADAFGQTILRVNQTASGSARDGTSWANAFTSLDEALAAAQPTAANKVEIWVAKGTYKPTTGTDRNAAFRLKSNLAIRGGFRGDETAAQPRNPWANPTVLSGDIGIPMVGAVTDLSPLPARPASADNTGWDDNCYNVLIGDGVTDVILEHLTITGASATDASISGAEIDGYEIYAPDTNKPGAQFTTRPSPKVVGGGLYFTTGSTWTVDKYGLQLLGCTFVRNRSRGYGGAVGIFDSCAYADTCSFIENASQGAGGAFWGLNQQTGFVKCSFTKNTSRRGGGAVSLRSLPSVRAEDPEVDDLTSYIQFAAFTFAGIDPPVKETKADARNRISQSLNHYSIYRAAQTATEEERAAQALADANSGTSSNVGGGDGLFDGMASGLNLTPLSNSDLELGVRTASVVGTTAKKLYQAHKAATTIKSRPTNAFEQIKFAVEVTDLFLDVLARFGVFSPNDPYYQAWKTVNAEFQKYVSTQGFANLIVDFNTQGKDMITPNMEVVKENALKNSYTQAGRSAFAACDFSENETQGMGGAVELAFNNLLVESCNFTDNHAIADGGAISSAIYNMPQIISSVFSNNFSDQGASAISNTLSSLMIVSNCTIINNISFDDDGAALSATMGADVRVYNSILWNNRNWKLESGADVLVTTKEQMSPETQETYQKLPGGQQANWIGIMDIRNSIVQSLKTIPLGEDKLGLILAGTNLEQEGIDIAIATRDAADAIGELEGSGVVNAGSGVRPKLRDPSYGNSDEDPLLLSTPLGKPSRLSAAYDGGNNQWATGRIIEHVTLVEDSLDVAYTKRILGSRVDIGAYERDPAARLDDNVPLASAINRLSTDGPAASGVGGGSAPVIGVNTPPGTTVYRVKPGAHGSGASWDDAADLQTAISQPNAEVWVAAGIYQPTAGTDRTASFSMAGGVKIFGGFAGSEELRGGRNWKTNPTIISGDTGVAGDLADNSRNLFKNVNVTGSALLDGFTLRDAYSVDSDGGAILNTDSSPIIRNCVFQNNHALNGGAIFSSGANEAGSILVNCEFRDNSAAAAGGAIRYTHALFGNNLVFSGNTATAGGGAISVTGSSANQYCTIQNGLFYSNSSANGAGGAIASRGLYLNVQNSTFYGNASTINTTGKSGGGAIDHAFPTEAGTASAMIINSIFYKNTAGNSANGSVETMEKRQILTPDPLLLSHSLVQGLNTYAGNDYDANFDGDPQFVEEGSDFRLKLWSMAIDAGDSTDFYTSFLTVDLNGNKRRLNREVDLGPYENTDTLPERPVSRVTLSSAGAEIFTFSANYIATPGDTVRWYVDRGDGLGYVPLGMTIEEANERGIVLPDESAGENVGGRTPTLTVTSPPNGFSYRLQVTRNGWAYLSPLTKLLPAADSRYVFVKPVATGDGNGTTWADATGDLQNAVSRAGAEVWVAQGTYRPGTERDAHFAMGQGVKIYGGFAGNETKRGKRDWRSRKTIISGEIGTSGITDNIKNLFINTNVGNSAILDGFYLQNAYGDGVNGGAIMNIASNPAIQNCVFEINHARNGGAISSTEISSGFGSKLSNCEFRKNSAELAGGAIYYTSSLSSSNLLFIDNTAEAGGAIHATGDANDQNVTLQNSLFAGNLATNGSGGGIWTSGLNLSVLNSTFYDNQAAIDSTSLSSGGAIYLEFPPVNASVLSVYNSIFYKNAALNNGTGGRDSVEKQQIFKTAANRHLIRNSLIDGLDTYRTGAADTNFEGDPLFVNEGTDFHVANGSLTVDSGEINGIPNLEAIDLDGADRVVNGSIDLGPYEHGATAGSPLKKVTAGSQGLENYNYTVQYAAQAGDTLQWYVDRGDGNGFVLLGASDPGHENLPVGYLGADSASLTIQSPPSGFLFRLQLNRGGVTFYSPVARLNPTEISKGSYIYVRPKATGDGSGSGWSNATTNLQEAMSHPNAQVWVEQGTYLPTSGTDRDVSFSLTAPGVKVYGGFKGTESLRDARNPVANVTTISGAIGGPSVVDNSKHLFKNQNVRNSVVLDGFTFEEAHADAEDGGAILNISASPTIQNCIFRNNYARNGGAIFSTGTPISGFGSDLFNCQFISNKAELTGGAISCNGSITAIRVVFRGNQAGAGGAVNLDGSSAGQVFTVKNGLFFNNRSLNGNGGAIFSKGLALNITNATFHGNQASFASSSKLGGGAIYQDYRVPGIATVAVINSIFYDNSSVNSSTGGQTSREVQQIAVKGDGGINADHSLIQGLDQYANTAVFGNFDENPEFVDATGGDFRLLNMSPAINSGVHSVGGGYILTDIDLDGNPRVQLDTVDLGPYEYIGTTAIGRMTSSSEFSSDVIRFFKNSNYARKPGDVLQWYVDRGDGNYVILAADSVYSGVDSDYLIITSPPSSADGYKFRLQVTNGGSALVSLPTVLKLPLKRIYVNATRLGTSADGAGWDTAYGDLVSALKASGPGSSIWVARGTYYPTSGSNTDAAFRIPSTVKIYGGFISGADSLDDRNPGLNRTILSGMINGATNRIRYSRHVVLNQGALERTALLDGFTLQDSYSSLMRNDGASPTVRNCVFQGNDSTWAADGAGAAISNVNGANPLIAECRFLRNTASSAGALYISGSSATVENSIFARNTAGAYGGTIVVDRGTLNMVHCTVADNTTRGVVAGLYGIESTVTVSNSIFWNNRTDYSGVTVYDQAIRMLGRPITLRYSCVEGGTSLPATNVVSNPLFDPSQEPDEYALAIYSPLVNTGSADDMVSSSGDLLGRPRVYENLPDMGAYELQSNAPVVKVQLSSLPKSRVSYNIGGTVDFVVTWPSGSSLDPRWTVVDSTNTALEPGRYTVIRAGNTSTVRINNLSVADSGIKVSFTDVAQGLLYTPPAILTIRVPRIVRVNATASGLNNGSSWTDAYTDLATALDQAQTADEIWVAGGIYTAGDRSSFRLKSTVSLYGGFSGSEAAREDRDVGLHSTVLRPMDNNPIVYGAARESEFGLPSVLDGFIVENGMGPVSVYNYVSDTTYRNCIFRNNASYLGSFLSETTYENCEFSGHAGRLFYMDQSRVGFKDCKIYNNTTTADLINSYNGSVVTFSDTVVSDNMIAGAFVRNGDGVEGGCSLNVLRSAFRGNSTGGAIIANNSVGTCAIESSLFAGNIASRDFATIQNSGTLSILASTFAENYGGSFGGGLATYPESITSINSCIFWGNRGSRTTSTIEEQQIGNGSGTLTVKRSILEGLATFNASSNYNTSYYPVFIDPTAGDYHLLANSPAIDTGEPNLALASPLDLDKAPRPLPVIYVDAGAYEFQGTATQALRISSYPASVATSETSGTSFFVKGPAFYGHQWQYWNGTGWVDVTNTGYFRVVNSANSDTSTLNIDTPPLSLNGTKFRVIITGSGGVSHTTGDLILTVNEPKVIYVNADTSLPAASTDGSTWAKAYKTLHEALAVTTEDCEIWVQAGTYPVNSTANLKWNVHLYGGFAGDETERDQRDWNANEVTLLANGKRIFSTTDPINRKAGHAVLDGFTLSGSTSEGALFLSASDAVISNCTFRGNTRAIGVSGRSNPVIADCIFDSHGSTVVNLDGDSATITGSTFLNNIDSSGGASGAIIYIFRGNVKISDSTFTGNNSSGGLIVTFGDYDATSAANLTAGKVTQLNMSRCVITGNTAYSGILATQSLLNLDNSLIAGNTLYTTAVRGYSRSLFNLTNVVIARNIGQLESVGINCDANVNLKNSIIWGNRTSWPYGPIISPGNPSLVENSQIKRNSWTYITNSIVEGAYAISGNGNSGYDPLFVDAAAMNYQLPAMSPAVNGGTATGIPADALDLSSQPRIHDTAPDMGGYEFTGVAETPIRMNSNLDDRTVIVGQDAEYSVRTAAGTNVQWQVKSGEFFVNVVPSVNQTLSTDGSVMTLSHLTIPQSGTVFRFVLSGDVSYTSAPGVLTVVPKPLIFVNANATGDNNGSSWEDAFTSINDAINGASDLFTGGPREIWVAQGTYLTGASLAPGVELVGGFAGNETERVGRNVLSHPTILTRSLTATSSIGYDLLSNSNPDPKKIGIVIDGFTLTGSSSGVTAREAPVLIKNCTFAQMAGYSLINASGPMTVEDCTFDRAEGVAVNVGPWSTTIIRRSIFQGCKSTVVQSGHESTISIEDSIFRDNAPVRADHPVLYIVNGSTVDVTRSQFIENHNSRAIFNDGRFFIRQSLIAGNSGSGIDMSYRAEATQLTSVTVADNEMWGIGIGWQNFSLRLTNSIIAGNKFHQQIYTDSGGVFATYTLIQGENYGGTGTQSWDPLFTNPEAGDYSLSPRSPAINAGSASAVNAGETDLTGNTRIQSGVPDLGAYESASAPDPLYRSALPVSLTTTRGVDGVFSLTGASSYAYTWQYYDGQEWINITFNGETGLGEVLSGIPVRITTIGGVTTLRIPAPVLGTSGLQVRVSINDEGVTSDPLILTVNEPEIMYVDASVPASGDGKTWSSAFKTLTEATARVIQSRRIIYIAKGTYQPSASGFDIGQRMEIYGGFPTGGAAFSARDPLANRVILNGELGDPAASEDNASPVLGISGVNFAIGADTIIDGLTVDGGKTGISVTTDAFPTLRNLIVSNNTRSGLSMSMAGGRVENCQFLGNSSINPGGGALLQSSRVTFSGCAFRGNRASSGGGLLIFDGSVRVENTVVSGNQSIAEGGGIVVQSGSHMLLNSTVTGNYSSGTSGGGGGGGLYINQGNVAVWNTILWGNRTDQSTRNVLAQDSIEVQQLNRYPFGAGFNVQGSDIEGLAQYAGAGANINADPLFFSSIAATDAPTIAGDFHLYGGSPVIDKGTPDLIGSLLIDADGAPRSARIVDIGAYELQGSAIALQPADLVYSAGSGNQYQVQMIETNAGDAYQWETSTNGSVFTPLTDGPAYSGTQTATLQVLTANPARHGNVFRVKITATDGGMVFSRSALLTVYADQYYVNAAAADDSGDGYSWATAFKTLGNAIAKARPHPTNGARIWVANGIYLPSATDTAVSFPLKSNIALYGGFAGNEATLAARDFSSHQTILKGIAGSVAVFANSGDIAITGARIDGFAINTATTGISLADANVTLTVANSNFTGLDTGINVDSDSVTVENSRFTGMSLYGIYNVSGSLSVADSVFESSQRGILQVFGNLNVARSAFRGNGSPDLNGGGILNNLGSATIDSSLFSGNYSLSGGGVYAQAGQTTVRNSTFAGSRGGLTRAFANGGYGALQVYNSVFGQNAYLFYDTKVQADTFVANNVHDLNPLPYGDFSPTNGNGNTSLDPLFVAPVAFDGPTTAGDYRLSPSSPLINKGRNDQRGASLTDLAGFPRTFDTTVDIGAYELQLIQLAITSQPMDSVGGVDRNAVFNVATNHPADATYKWQVNLNGTWTDVAASADESGVTSAILTVAGNAAYDGRLYRVHVTTPDSGGLFSNAVTYRYTFVVVSPPAGVRNATLTGASSSISFDVAGGALRDSIVDGSFAVHAMQTGRLSLADGSLTDLNVVGNTVSMRSAVPFKAGELVEVTTTADVQRADSFYTVPLVYQFHAGNRGGYGVFPVPTAIPDAPATARSLASGDINGTGSIDLVVGGTDGAAIWLNGGTAAFTAGEAFSSGTISQVLLGSLGFSGSRKLDIILRKSTGEVEIWKNEGDGTFTISSTITGTAATSLALADLNGDGSLDLFIATAGADQVWFNNGAGVFNDSTQRLGSVSGVSVTVGDFNNDNSLDVATANGGAGVELWINNGAGQFSAGQSIDNSTLNRVIASDVDRDGRLDLIGVMTTGSLRVLKQRSNSNFVGTSLSSGVYGGSPDALNVGDIDGDGIPDLISSSSTGSAPIRLWKGQGFDSGTDRTNFQQVTDQPEFPLNKATDFADLNGDGMMDLITVNAAGNPTVSLYRTGSTPAAPSNLDVGSPTDTTLKLTWTDNATNETGYSVERSPNGNNSWSFVASLPADATTFTDSSLNSSTPYWYRVRCDIDGIFQSGYSNLDSAYTNTPAPDITVAYLNGAELSSGAVVDFGSVAPGAKGVLTFTVGNIGTANLSALRMQLVDGEYYDYEFSNFSATTLGINQTTRFTLTFNAWTRPRTTATLRILSNDPDESVFTLSLRGISSNAPTFDGYSFTAAYETATTIASAKLLAKASDIDGDVISITGVGASANGGGVTLQPISLTYTPPPGFSGTDQFPVTFSDAHGATVTGQVVVTVLPASAANEMTANPPKLTIVPGGKMSLSFQGIPGRTYLIQRSTNMSDWTTIATQVAGGTGKIEFIDDNPPQPSGFYRLKKP